IPFMLRRPVGLRNVESCVRRSGLSVFLISLGMAFTLSWSLGVLAQSTAAPRSEQPALRNDSPAIFEEVPPSASGITWSHDNAMSTERYLPETLGPGAAFLDYDNDGWMDIYFVNYGPCDFFKPTKPIRNALYHNNHDGTFTDVTEKAGVPGGTFGMG